MLDAEKNQAYTLAKKPAPVSVPGNKIIEEFIGKLNTETDKYSVAKMVAPPGWQEPAQTPLFDEITIVISGRLQAEINGRKVIIGENETFVAHKNHTVTYSNPFDADAVYWAICMPAFSIETVNREPN